MKNSIDILNNLISDSIVLSKDWINILSTILDVMDSNIFKSCSAINPSGLNFEQLDQSIKTYQDKISHQEFIGFYEYNPIFDNISNCDAKKIAWQINTVLKRIKKSPVK